MGCISRQWALALCALAACSAGAHPSGTPTRSTDALAQSAVVRSTDEADGRAANDSAMAAYFAWQIETKRMTDETFQAVLGKEMHVEKIAYSGADDLTIPAYLFTPKHSTRPRPTILFVHGGVHGDFQLVHLEQVRALVRLGYIVLAPDYRGSTGYGRQFYEAIDYGGKEVDDVIAARAYLARNVSSADLNRLGIMGYSHGGFIALHAVLRHPEFFKVAVAHVPVADLPTRMRTHPEWYRQIFAAQPAFGGTLETNPKPYIERSPVAHARELRTPLLVHAADNDDDVFIIENHHLRDSMHVAGKDTAGLYTYREWHDPPGGHSFGILDTPQGRESWAETVTFLAKYLKP
jgi:dipeptidyl aminopeptidase/acylaminoacyl peptidase